MAKGKHSPSSPLANVVIVKNDGGKDNSFSPISGDSPRIKIALVTAHLESGHSITPIEALDMYGSFRLSGIISKLRKRGYNIRTERETYPATGSRFARYTMITDRKA